MRGEPTSNAYTWSSAKRKVRPTHRFKRSPSFRSEFICIGPVEVLSSVKSVGVYRDESAFRYEDSGFSIQAPAARDESVLVGETTIQRQDWIKSEN